MDSPPRDDQRIGRITLDERLVIRRSAEIEHERAVAIFDLLEANRFVPQGGAKGPFDVHLGLRDGRSLVIEVSDAAAQPIEPVILPMSPFRTLIKDYFTICESYFEAIKRASPSQIEAIDMGRRGLHNEGSEVLRERLAGKVEIDLETARRLFTLICVLHIRG
ncbi:MAG: UPF0262 family protein [Alphaproteobacteria bacterium]|nr:UPF0262 family protein [Alphaproteobacteria bacterium]